MLNTCMSSEADDFHEILTHLPDITEEECDEADNNWVTFEQQHSKDHRYKFLKMLLETLCNTFINDVKKITYEDYINGKVIHYEDYSVIFVDTMDEDVTVHIYSLSDDYIYIRSGYDTSPYDKLVASDQVLITSLLDKYHFRDYITATISVCHNKYECRSHVKPPTFTLTLALKLKNEK